ncbi:hypothetical protein PHISCL_01951 [Aspergillus sclerotialis]|uniref:Uncharacterized protein n=1 Tax=Aspergillus sclerotialis TaxID=2070753 RepID=A0A3A2ZRA0_9EURO|nr:hypothetical protein PHISCL_01951 [Aspergillus sclerotialis]
MVFAKSNKVKKMKIWAWHQRTGEIHVPRILGLRLGSDENGGSHDGNILMTPCSGSDYSDTWCCGTSNDCCGTDSEVHIPSNIYQAASSTSASVTSLPSASHTSTSNPTSTSAQSTSTSTSAPSNDSSSGLSEGGKAGVGVGVGVGGCAILAVLFFFLNRRRKQKTVVSQTTPFTPIVGQHEIPVAHAYEKPAGLEDQRFEKPASVPDQRFELPSESAARTRP